MAYLDYNATAPVLPSVLAAMRAVEDVPLNASSIHAAGRRAKKLLEDARSTIAQALGAFANEVIFVSSGSEANTMVLRAFADRPILVSAIEHASIRKTGALLGAAEIPVDSNGVVKLDVLEGMLGALSFSSVDHSPPGPPVNGGDSLSASRAQHTEGNRSDLSTAEKVRRTSATFTKSEIEKESPPFTGGQGGNLPRNGPLVSIMLANNETGVMQPIKAIADIVHAHGGLLHCDAVQALGKIPLDWGLLRADMLTISGHKVGGPLGAAVLLIRNDLPIRPLITGGGQELGRRAGTENIPAIVGLAALMSEVSKVNESSKYKSLIEKLKVKIRAVSSDAIFFGEGAERLPNTLQVSMPNVKSETQLIHFDLKGFAVSAGSACSSGRIEPSAVLLAMGIPRDIAATAIRISIGWATTEDEIDAFAACWVEAYQKLSKPKAA